MGHDDGGGSSRTMPVAAVVAVCGRGWGGEVPASASNFLNLKMGAMTKKSLRTRAIEFSSLDLKPDDVNIGGFRGGLGRAQAPPEIFQAPPSHQNYKAYLLHRNVRVIKLHYIRVLL